MHIQLEAHETHTIQAYHETGIQINHQQYHASLLLSRDWLITPIQIEEISAHLEQFNLEVMLLGAHEPSALRKNPHLQQLEKALIQKQIGIEYMHLDAACRTFNILLSEHRQVVAGFIFNFA